MTWNPLKKKCITIRPTPAPPLISSMKDRDLDILVQKLVHFEDISKFLIKKIKQYYQQIIVLDEADRHFSTHLSECDLVHFNDNLRTIVEDYYSVTEQVGKTVQNIKRLGLLTFVDPLKKFRDEFMKVESSLAKREELVGTWKIVYSRVQKLQEKKDRIACHIAKLEIESRAMETIGKEVLDYHEELIIAFRTLIDKRLRIIGPCIHALIMIQLDYHGNMTKMFTNLISVQTNLSDSPNSSAKSEQKCKENITNEMARIKNLTIIKSLKI